MLARVSKWVALLTGKTYIGNDLAGNSYYTKPFRRLDGVLTEKRWVEFKGDPDPTTVPVEWSSWLHHTRSDAPTPEEMLELANKRRMLKIKVALLKEEEEKLRFKARSMKTGEGVDMSAQSMEKFMKQIAAGDKRETAFTPEKWTEDGPDSSTEPSGTRDEFVPGKWKPS